MLRPARSYSRPVSACAFPRPQSGYFRAARTEASPRLKDPKARSARWYNFARINSAVRMSPAMAASLTGRLWEIGDIVKSKIGKRFLANSLWTNRGFGAVKFGRGTLGGFHARI